MDYRWRYQDAQGRDVAGPAETFDGQTEAEDWLSDAWQELRDAGADQVTLLHGEAEVYGPMSLHGA
ncbi:hypothetical protein F0L68_08040 [Solihabitans fulvus]|uniref:Uncharacterized protein n=1 Tax=Solihabitans fulvus TaxID=1892852 RepID=A0A5B2XLT8_9PSEU|nr:hypothetical protein [Solihabitans fulvus]KAA2264353.1 hypothetical protein F0L68_08040 [Solihabitans fulvus]